MSSPLALLEAGLIMVDQQFQHWLQGFQSILYRVKKFNFTCIQEDRHTIT